MGGGGDGDMSMMSSRSSGEMDLASGSAATAVTGFHLDGGAAAAADDGVDSFLSFVSRRRLESVSDDRRRSLEGESLLLRDNVR